MVLIFHEAYWPLFGSLCKERERGGRGEGRERGGWEPVYT